MRVVLLLLTLLIAGGPARSAEGDQAAIRSVIESQIDAFRRDDAASAYGYAAPLIQRLFPSDERFMAMVREGYRPVYRSRSLNFRELKESADGLTQSVLIQDADGVDWLALYTLERQPDGSWKISGCSLTKEPGQSV